MYINNINPGLGMGMQGGFGGFSGFPGSAVINYSFVPTASGWRAGAGTGYPAVSLSYNPALGWHTDIQAGPFSGMGQYWGGFGQPVISGLNLPLASGQPGGFLGGISPMAMGMAHPLSTGFPGLMGGINPVSMGMAQPMTTGFSGMMGGMPVSSTIAPTTGMIQPRIELAETNSDVVVTAELPNINPNNLQLTVTDDSLSISALAISGGMTTSLHRTVALPCSVRAEHVDATYSNGILEARLPKSDLTARRRVKVNVTG
ncbi:Hsp20/alpha crystallin family protein [Neomoorella mulderi]|uniref:Hsp20/alpha crystallin family protein n=1 Tax=Moorella mulderi DSM 14980 TaxID=1122241 RepID=A0A151ATA9_9FIRM|nr:Hsp20/alpha crystallin family protein [Moorella mulderi]KYH30822.1 Hsp20/alpha crystallin family protein [Moorella mulderi DSM 14980]